MDDETKVKKTLKYSLYKKSVQSSLSSFEKVSEWADLLIHLEKLRNTIKKNSKIKILPMHTPVCKTLSQCLNPILPIGVHKKTLEIYTIIFQNMTEKHICKHLPQYTFGLFSFFPNCSVQIKPSVIKIFKENLLSLGNNIVPALPGFINALLYGFEEEGSEIYKGCMEILENLRRINYKSTILSVWKVVNYIDKIRVQGLNYLRIVFEKEKNLQYLVQGEKMLVINSILHCLLSPTEKVVKTALDVLSNIFPTNNDLFTESIEKVALMCGVLPKICEGDPQIDRRIFSYLFSHTDYKEDYFLKYTRTVLFESIKTMFNKSLCNVFEKGDSDTLGVIIESLEKKISENKTFSVDLVTYCIDEILEYVKKREKKNLDYGRIINVMKNNSNVLDVIKEKVIKMFSEVKTKNELLECSYLFDILESKIFIAKMEEEEKEEEESLFSVSKDNFGNTFSTIVLNLFDCVRKNLKEDKQDQDINIGWMIVLKNIFDKKFDSICMKHFISKEGENILQFFTEIAAITYQKESNMYTEVLSLLSCTFSNIITILEKEKVEKCLYLIIDPIQEEKILKKIELTEEHKKNVLLTYETFCLCFLSSLEKKVEVSMKEKEFKLIINVLWEILDGNEISFFSSNKIVEILNLVDVISKKCSNMNFVEKEMSLTIINSLHSSENQKKYIFLWKVVNCYRFDNKHDESSSDCKWIELSFFDILRDFVTKKNSPASKHFIYSLITLHLQSNAEISSIINPIIIKMMSKKENKNENFVLFRMIFLIVQSNSKRIIGRLINTPIVEKEIIESELVNNSKDLLKSFMNYFSFLHSISLDLMQKYIEHNSKNMVMGILKFLKSLIQNLPEDEKKKNFLVSFYVRFASSVLGLVNKMIDSPNLFVYINTFFDYIFDVFELFHYLNNESKIRIENINETTKTISLKKNGGLLTIPNELIGYRNVMYKKGSICIVSIFSQALMKYEKDSLMFTNFCDFVLKFIPFFSSFGKRVSGNHFGNVDNYFLYKFTKNILVKIILPYYSKVLENNTSVNVFSNVFYTLKIIEKLFKVCLPDNAIRERSNSLSSIDEKGGDNSGNQSSGGTLNPFGLIEKIFWGNQQKTSKEAKKSYNVCKMLVESLGWLFDSFVKIWRKIGEKSRDYYDLKGSILYVLKLVMKNFPFELMKIMILQYVKIHSVDRKDQVSIKEKKEERTKEIFEIIIDCKVENIFDLVIDCLDALKEKKKDEKIFEHEIDSFLFGFFYFIRKKQMKVFHQKCVRKCLNYFKSKSNPNLYCVCVFLQTIVFFHEDVKEIKDDENTTIEKGILRLERELVIKLIEGAFQTIIREMKTISQQKGNRNSANQKTAQIEIFKKKKTILEFFKVFNIKILPKFLNIQLNYYSDSSTALKKTESIIGIIHNQIIHFLKFYHRVDYQLVIEETIKTYFVMFNITSNSTFEDKIRFSNLKNVRKSLTDYFNSNYGVSSFRLQVQSLERISPIFKEILREKVLFDLLDRLPQYNVLTPNIFVNKEFDVQIRCRVFKRIAYMILINSDLFCREKVLKRLFNQIRLSLKYSNYATDVVKSVIFLLRVIVFRTKKNILKIFISTIVFELIKVFLATELKENVFYEAVRFLDFFSICKPDLFQKFHWMFIKDPQVFEIVSDKKVFFRPYLNSFVPNKKVETNRKGWDVFYQNLKNNPTPIQLTKDERKKKDFVIEYIVKLASSDRTDYLQTQVKKYKEEELFKLILSELCELKNDEIAFVNLLRKKIYSDKKKKKKTKENWVVVEKKE